MSLIKKNKFRKMVGNLVHFLKNAVEKCEVAIFCFLLEKATSWASKVVLICYRAAILKRLRTTALN